MKHYIILILAALLLYSCKTQPAEPTPKTEKTKVSNANFFASIHKKSAFQYLKINSKIEAKTGKFLPTIDATIYIENGEKVWMNMSALFINVARGIATPEGIQGYERWNKNYIESDFAYINNLLNVNFIDYQSFQNLLLGKTFVPVSEKDFTLTQTPSGYALVTDKNQKVKVNGKTTEYKINLDYSSSFELNKVLLQEISSPNTLEVSYANWENIGEERFPKNVKIIIKGEKNSQVLIENTKFEFSKSQAPYSVPKGYTKVEIK